MPNDRNKTNFLKHTTMTSHNINNSFSGQELPLQ
jgi:hypothetical protein